MVELADGPYQATRGVGYWQTVPSAKRAAGALGATGAGSQTTTGKGGGNVILATDPPTTAPSTDALNSEKKSFAPLLSPAGRFGASAPISPRPPIL